MSSNSPVQKRHNRNRLGERRANRDPSSSRDASEEDNDNVENSFSDVGSMNSYRAEALSTTSTIDSPTRMPPPPLPPHTASGSPSTTQAGRRSYMQRRVEELSGEGSQSESLDSPTYDGDVESSSTIGGAPAHHQHNSFRSPSFPTPVSASDALHRAPHTVQRQPTPKATQTGLSAADYPAVQTPKAAYVRPSDVPVAPSVALDECARGPPATSPFPSPNSARGPPKMYTRAVERTEEDIKGFVERAIQGRGQEDGVERWWKTNPPPEGKVVRVYADGVYDLFHFGHALQLRQAKLSFSQVHLMVGVCSDVLCAQHKSAPAMTHAERCEAVRHCRWADEVIPDAPWVVDQAFLDKYQIDYIAHDEEVYPSKNHEDVYAFAKKEGRFVPTRRTPAISTSDLLERIVRGYRDGFFDSKLEKNGHPELLAADVDWDSSASMERREKRKAAHHHKVKK
ncbi:choline-phosphate cytidylyltransferase [Cryptococcus bacillisporus CA1873]|uniref:choline-phosphate cytidylyltransferase n=1 Tax=Cryptococcus bacillisporus CA1873 TaxID=1296111 RepID=A0ABR5BJH3_CRYGA|nr:choline-phosphate cytidylyltransferase [Cryptococcus bacillisporus CA1873]|eukprot:KIR69333.1 choline-phosphate cytidylyltransferase [Cryptococcus gattii CA1873]